MTEFEGNPEACAIEVLRCALSHNPNARLIGDVLPRMVKKFIRHNGMAEMKHRVWFDPKYEKHETETEDGIDFDEPTPEAAAEAFALDRYADYQQLGKGVVLVRDPTGQVTRFNIGVRIVFTVAKVELRLDESP